MDILDAILSARLLAVGLAQVVGDGSQRTATQLAIGIYSLVENLLLEGDSHIAVQDGVLAQRLPLVEVHGTRQNLHRAVVTHGGIDLDDVVGIVAQVIHDPCEQVAAALDDRVVRIYPLEVLITLGHHTPAVVGSGAVAEEGRE